MKQSQAIVLLLVASCVAIAAAKPVMRPMFADWLDQESARTAGIPASIAADSSEYEPEYPPLEHEVLCLKEVKTENCACDSTECVLGANATSCCISKYHESVFSCCNGITTDGNYYYPDGEEYSYGDGMDPVSTDVVPIGSCDTKATFFKTPIKVSNCDKIGTFTKVCHIAHGALCGSPFCDGLILKQEGNIFRSWAISKTDPAAPENSCTTKAGTPAQLMGYGGDSYPGSPTTTPPVCTVTTAGGKYYKSMADMWTGPVTIYSRKHHFKYHFGTMEYAKWYKENVTCTNDEKLPLVVPYTYTLKMNKPLTKY